MAAITVTKTLEVPMTEESAWTMVLTHERDDETVHVGLHYNNKPLPTHEAWVTVADIKELLDLA